MVIDAWGAGLDHRVTDGYLGLWPYLVRPSVSRLTS